MHICMACYSLLFPWHAVVEVTFEDVVIPTPESVSNIVICINVSGELERQAEVMINQVGGSAQCKHHYAPCTN